MNNFDGWEQAKDMKPIILEKWHPHFDILTNSDNKADTAGAFFILNDNTAEFLFYTNAQAAGQSDFADYMEDAKEKMIDVVGFDMASYEDCPVDKKTAGEMTADLQQKIHSYTKRTGQDIKILFYNYLMYQEWMTLPDDVLEKRYADEMAAQEVDNDIKA